MKKKKNRAKTCSASGHLSVSLLMFLSHLLFIPFYNNIGVYIYIYIYVCVYKYIYTYVTIRCSFSRSFLSPLRTDSGVLSPYLYLSHSPLSSTCLLSFFPSHSRISARFSWTLDAPHERVSHDHREEAAVFNSLESTG